ncbi:MAG TPA: tRNA (adenosine(37)-N6)-threonylcarbamoyltransferase complex dimerization subunit type 1 TsaB [Cytophagales bacterium]|nr:tRNA (adenosine(37)-N6)-threonylcarbamoyltransferase complex dimerization subunit type 1 TsaB [Cytophagales bacterium]
MAIILSLETTTEVCSVSIHGEEMLLSYVETHISKSHSEKITLQIDQVLALSNLSIKEIDAIAVSKGPGSYTGLRVGVSTAKGLCMALEKPLLAINSLEAMALEVSFGLTEEMLLCPMLDARRMEVYCAMYNKDLILKSETSALILEEISFSNKLNDHKVLFFGSGAEKFKRIIKSRNAFFIDGIYPKAKFIGLLAKKSFDNQLFEDLHLFEPFYLKDFVLTKKSN